MTETTAIFIPAMRPQFFERIVTNIADATPEPYKIYWAVTADLTAELDRLDQTYIVDEGAPWGVRLNALFDATDKPYFFAGADDLRWHLGWLSAAMNMMHQIDGVVSVNDMWQGGGTSALVSRNYINTMSGCMDQDGVVIHPGYKHHGSETELFQTARKRGRYAYCVESVVEHLHCANGKAPEDEVYAMACVQTLDNVAYANTRRHLWA